MHSLYKFHKAKRCAAASLRSLRDNHRLRSNAVESSPNANPINKPIRMFLNNMPNPTPNNIKKIKETPFRLVSRFSSSLTIPPFYLTQ